MRNSTKTAPALRTRLGAVTVNVAALVPGLIVLWLLVPRVAQPPGRPECPGHDGIWDGDSGKLVQTLVPASGERTHVPEYHDCQRLVNYDRTAFGPMIALFASKALDDVRPLGPGVVVMAV